MNQITLQYCQLIALSIPLIIGVIFLTVVTFKKDTLNLASHNMKVDYIATKNIIKACCCEKQLHAAMAIADSFFIRHHKSDSNNKELQMYYAFLLRAISEKREQINEIDRVTA